MSDIHSGSCLCTAVRFKTRGELRELIFCHCTQCRKQTGLYYAATNVPDRDLELKVLRMSPGIARATALNGASAVIAGRPCSGKPMGSTTRRSWPAPLKSRRTSNPAITSIAPTRAISMASTTSCRSLTQGDRKSLQATSGRQAMTPCVRARTSGDARQLATVS